MAEDLEDLRARVAAARDRLNSDVDFAQKVELRLNDLARIVDGSLARQSAELESAKARISTLDEDLARALSRAEQAAGDAAQADRLGKENGELRSMVMTLLEVIEGRQKSSLSSVMQKLEENVSALVSAPVAAAPVPPPAPAREPAIRQIPAIAIPTTVVRETVPDETPESAEAAWDEPLSSAPETAPEDEVELEMEPAAEEEAAKEPAPMEDLSEIALYDASEEVVEPEKA